MTAPTQGDPEPEAALASGTLAQLYWDQGHPKRARAVCEELLVRDPHHGYALVLRDRLDRLRATPQADLEARFVPTTAADLDLGVGELELTWSVPRALLAPYTAPRVDIILAITQAADRNTAALHYSSIRCRELTHQRRVDVPLGPASAAIALVLGSAHEPLSHLVGVHARRPLQFLAITPPVSW